MVYKISELVPFRLIALIKVIGSIFYETNQSMMFNICKLHQTLSVKNDQ